MWTCRKCGEQWTNGKLRCTCGRKAPKRRASHTAILREMPYEDWVEIYGEQCGICGRGPSETRRLDRDHDHRTGHGRGLLCHRCNRGLPNWADADWLRKAADYLDAARSARV